MHKVKPGPEFQIMQEMCIVIVRRTPKVVTFQAAVTASAPSSPAEAVSIAGILQSHVKGVQIRLIQS